MYFADRYQHFRATILRMGAGCAIAQAVSRQLPTGAVQVRAQVRSCGISGEQSGTGAGFPWVLRFPLPILIPLTVPCSSSSIIWGWYNRPNSVTKWTQSHPTPGGRGMGRASTSEPSVPTCWTQCHIPDDSNFYLLSNQHLLLTWI
jgi:hypothetical protein